MSEVKELEKLVAQEEAELEKAKEALQAAKAQESEKAKQRETERQIKEMDIGAGAVKLDIHFMDGEDKVMLNPEILRLYVLGQVKNPLHKRDLTKAKLCCPEHFETEDCEMDEILFKKLEQASLDYHAEREAARLKVEAAREATLDKLRNLGLTEEDLQNLGL